MKIVESEQGRNDERVSNSQRAEKTGLVFAINKFCLHQEDPVAMLDLSTSGLKNPAIGQPREA